MTLIVILLAFINGILSAFVIHIYGELNSYKRNFYNLQEDIEKMGDSFQGIINTLVDKVNSHSDQLNKQQKAIDYLIEEDD